MNFNDPNVIVGILPDTSPVLVRFIRNLPEKIVLVQVVTGNESQAIIGATVGYAEFRAVVTNQQSGDFGDTDGPHVRVHPDNQTYYVLAFYYGESQLAVVTVSRQELLTQLSKPS